MTAGVSAEGGIEMPDAALAVRADETGLAASPRDAEHPGYGDALDCARKIMKMALNNALSDSGEKKKAA